MTKELIERSRRRHAFADVPLFVLATLVLSLVIALTAVSIGIARADKGAIECCSLTRP